MLFYAFSKRISRIFFFTIFFSICFLFFHYIKILPFDFFIFTLWVLIFFCCLLSFGVYLLFLYILFLLLYIYYISHDASLCVISSNEQIKFIKICALSVYFYVLLNFLRSFFVVFSILPWYQENNLRNYQKQA